METRPHPVGFLFQGASAEKVLHWDPDTLMLVLFFLVIPLVAINPHRRKSSPDGVVSKSQSPSSRFAELQMQEQVVEVR